MRKNLLLDIDGVIADFYHGFAGFLNKNYAANLDVNSEPSNYSLFDWSPNLKTVDMGKATHDWILDGGFVNLPIYDGARDFVLDVADVCDVFVVTARIGDYKKIFPEEVLEKIKTDTMDWFAKYNIPVKSVYFEHKKVDFCKNNNIPIMVEDKLTTVLDASQNNIQCVLINRGWNQEANQTLPYFRALNYAEALKRIKEII